MTSQDVDGNVPVGTSDDAASTRFDTSQRIRDADASREQLIDQEVVELRRLLDQVDGLTFDARRRLRRIEELRGGISPDWASRHR